MRGCPLGSGSYFDLDVDAPFGVKAALCALLVVLFLHFRRLRALPHLVHCARSFAAYLVYLAAAWIDLFLAEEFGLAFGHPSRVALVAVMVAASLAQAAWLAMSAHEFAKDRSIRWGAEARVLAVVLVLGFAAALSMYVLGSDARIYVRVAAPAFLLALGFMACAAVVFAADSSRPSVGRSVLIAGLSLHAVHELILFASAALGRMDDSSDSLIRAAIHLDLLALAAIATGFAVWNFEDERARTLEMQVTLAKSEEVLRLHQKMEVAARLAGGAAHEFNNKLAAIQAHNELLLEQAEDPDAVRGTSRAIDHATQGAKAIASQLLSLARRGETRPEKLEIGSMLERSAPLLRQVAGKSIDLSVRVDGPLWTRADPGQLEQVLLNLVLNARDAQPNGGRIVLACSSIELAGRRARELELSPGSYCEIRCADSGGGMSKETLSHLFEPFFTTRPYGKGTGLGLSIAFRIVESAGGMILVESELHKGSTFRVLLPRVSAPEVPSSSMVVSGARPVANGARS